MLGWKSSVSPAAAGNQRTPQQEVETGALICVLFYNLERRKVQHNNRCIFISVFTAERNPPVELLLCLITAHRKKP